MKLLILIIAMLVSTIAIADTYVKGYYKSNGTYVQPHYRSDPDSSVSNNWSTKGNVNPYTGKVGTVNQFDTKPMLDSFGNKDSFYDKYPGLKPR